MVNKKDIGFKKKMIKVIYKIDMLLFYVKIYN